MKLIINISCVLNLFVKYFKGMWRSDLRIMGIVVIKEILFLFKWIFNVIWEMSDEISI